MVLPNHLPNEVMTAKRAYEEEDNLSPEELPEPERDILYSGRLIR